MTTKERQQEAEKIHAIYHFLKRGDFALVIGCFEKWNYPDFI